MVSASPPPSAATCLLCLQMFVLCPVAALAESGFLAHERVAGSESRPHSSGGMLQLDGPDLASYIATGQLPGSVLHGLRGEEPHVVSDGGVSLYEEDSAEHAAEQAQTVKLDIIDKYLQRLLVVKTRAENAYRAVMEQEAKLTYNFQPVRKTLQLLADRAMEAASKAEVDTLRERLKRVHYQQLAGLHRSKAYWETQLAENKQLADDAEDQKKKLQKGKKKDSDKLKSQKKKLDEQRDNEKEQLKQWKQRWEDALEKSEFQQKAWEKQQEELRRLKLQAEKDAMVDEVVKRAESELGVPARDETTD